MPTFPAPDGTQLAYHVAGSGEPLLCLPGGPMQASEYLGDLGGLAAHRQLILLDLRGTGESAQPLDPSTYRVDRQVADVEALRAHLDLDRIDLLGHSAGASLAVGYAAAHPNRVASLALITPSPRPFGIETAADDRWAQLRGRAAEPWYPEVAAAFEAVAAGRGTDADWAAMAPMSYGRWDETARAHHAAETFHSNNRAAGIYYSDGAIAPAATRAAAARLTAPVLVLAGGLDWGTTPTAAAEVAAAFPAGTLVVQPGAAHFPWLDDPAAFTASLADFLR